jgi:hypothetical protein
MWKSGVEINVGISANDGFHSAEFKASRSQAMDFRWKFPYRILFKKTKNIENRGKFITPLNDFSQFSRNSRFLDKFWK